MRKNGLTLIETLIALSVSSVVILAGVYTFSAYYRTFGKMVKKADSLLTKQIVLREIVKDCRGASSMTVAGGSAAFTNKISTIAYDIKDRKVRRRENSFSAYLTDTDEIKELKFALLSPKLLRITADDCTTEAFRRNE